MVTMLIWNNWRSYTIKISYEQKSNSKDKLKFDYYADIAILIMCAMIRVNLIKYQGKIKQNQSFESLHSFGVGDPQIVITTWVYALL